MAALRWLWRGHDALVTAAWWGAILCAAAMLVLIVVDVSLRIAGFRPPAATIGLVEYSLLYLAMLSAPRLVREGQHIVVETVIGALSGWPRLLLEKAIYLAAALTCGVLGYAAWLLTAEKLASGTLDLRGIDLPSWLLPAPIAAGCLLCAVEFLRFLLSRHSFYTARGTETIL
ncbi:MAG: TRAP transporter small permease subunit [Acetobacteraceae bacterium]|nr:TRAP transporter small permease subunit [Acetobacteraceae bacterium]